MQERGVKMTSRDLEEAFSRLRHYLDIPKMQSGAAVRVKSFVAAVCREEAVRIKSFAL